MEYNLNLYLYSYDKYIYLDDGVFEKTSFEIPYSPFLILEFDTVEEERYGEQYYNN